MKIFADLHIHSKYSRATSPDMTLENLDKWAKIKGINVLSTGDFTHPKWFREIKEKLELAEAGLYKLKGENHGTRFILTTETSSIYTKGGKCRRVHNLIFMPSTEKVEELNSRLNLIGNIKSDGRPIIGLGSKELLKLCLSISPKTFFVPCHIWTPWFSVFGSKSGFDSLEECFDELTDNIFAVETGISSDPDMNWRLSMLDKISLISNSDSHSLMRLGRETNVFETELSYDGIIEAIKSKDPKKFLYTIEFFPEQGRYHYDGHRDCKVSFSPQESKKHNNICPKCNKPLVIGTMNRVEELADREIGYKPEKTIPFKKTVPLDQIIADSLGVGASSKKVIKYYEDLVKYFSNEFNVLFEANEKDLELASLPEIAEGIIRVRQGKLHIEPGYDGEYGKVEIFNDQEREGIAKQKSLL